MKFFGLFLFLSSTVLFAAVDEIDLPARFPKNAALYCPEALGGGVSTTFPFRISSTPSTEDAIVLDKEVPVEGKNGVFAYRNGYYPYFNHLKVNPKDRLHQWESPEKRGVILLEEALIAVNTEKMQHTLASAIYDHGLKVTINQAFDRVVQRSANIIRYRNDRKRADGTRVYDLNLTDAVIRYFSKIGGLEEISALSDENIREQTISDRDGFLTFKNHRIPIYSTWLSPRLITFYTEMYKQGNAISIEVWDGENLVAGQLGVYVDGHLTGESVFHEESAGKKQAGFLAAAALVELARQSGIKMIDVQSVQDGGYGVSHFFHGRNIPRAEFLERLQTSLSEAKPLAVTNGLLTMDGLLNSKSRSLKIVKAIKAGYYDEQLKQFTEKGGLEAFLDTIVEIRGQKWDFRWHPSKPKQFFPNISGEITNRIRDKAQRDVVKKWLSARFDTISWNVFPDTDPDFKKSEPQHQFTAEQVQGFFASLYILAQCSGATDEELQNLSQPETIQQVLNNRIFMVEKKAPATPKK